MNRKEAVLHAIRGNWRETYELLGVRFADKGFGKEHKFHCPCSGHKNKDETAAAFLNVESGLWQCMVTKKGGNIFDMASLIHGLPNFPEQLSKVEELIASTPSEFRNHHHQSLPHPNISEHPQKKPFPGKPGWIDEYIYRDETGQILYRILKYPPDKGKKKSYSQGRFVSSGVYDHSPGALKNVRRVLYKLPELIEQMKGLPEENRVAFIPEGEKDVKRLLSLDLPAVCNSGGALKWSDDFTDQLVAAEVKKVVIFEDDDEPGRDHAQSVARSCASAGLETKIVRLEIPGNLLGGDVSDWLDASHTREELSKTIKKTPLFELDKVKISKGENKKNVPTVVCLADVEPEENSWLWYPYIPAKKLTVLEGDPGVMKSWLSLAVATSVSLGAGFSVSYSSGPRNVLLFSAEDGLADTIRTRLDSMEADVTRIHAWNTPITFDAEGLAAIENEINRIRPSLIIIDPIIAYISAKTDTYKANQIRAILAPLSSMAERCEVAILALRHLTKGDSNKAIYRGQGSIDFAASARSILLAGKDPEDSNRGAMAHTKSNLARLGPTMGYMIKDGRFEWTGQSELTPARLLSGDLGNEDLSAKKEAEFFLKETLAEGPKEANLIYRDAVAAGISKRTLQRAKKGLGIKSDREGFEEEGKYFWNLPDPHRSSTVSKDRQDSPMEKVANNGNLGDLLSERNLTGRDTTTEEMSAGD